MVSGLKPTRPVLIIIGSVLSRDQIHPKPRQLQTSFYQNGPLDNWIFGLCASESSVWTPHGYGAFVIFIVCGGGSDVEVLSAVLGSAAWWHGLLEHDASQSRWHTAADTLKKVGKVNTLPFTCTAAAAYDKLGQGLRDLSYTRNYFKHFLQRLISLNFQIVSVWST